MSVGNAAVNDGPITAVRATMCKLNARQQWALKPKRFGVPFRWLDSESRFKVAKTTAKRGFTERAIQQPTEFNVREYYFRRGWGYLRLGAYPGDYYFGATHWSCRFM